MADEMTGLFEEIEKLAQARNTRDFHFAASCANKILASIAPPPPAQEVEATSQSGVAEAHKAIKALDCKDFALAGLCLRKAIKGFAAGPGFPGVTVIDAFNLRAHVSEISHSISEQDFSTAADYVRRSTEYFTLGAEAPKPVADPATAPTA